MTDKTALESVYLEAGLDYLEIEVKSLWFVLILAFSAVYASNSDQPDSVSGTLAFIGSFAVLCGIRWLVTRGHRKKIDRILKRMGYGRGTGAP